MKEGFFLKRQSEQRAPDVRAEVRDAELQLLTRPDLKTGREGEGEENSVQRLLRYRYSCSLLHYRYSCSRRHGFGKSLHSKSTARIHPLIQT